MISQKAENSLLVKKQNQKDMADFLVPRCLFLEYLCHSEGTGTWATVPKDGEEEPCLGRKALSQGDFLCCLASCKNLQILLESFTPGVQSLKPKPEEDCKKQTSKQAGEQGDAGHLTSGLAEGSEPFYVLL